MFARVRRRITYANVAATLALVAALAAAFVAFGDRSAERRDPGDQAPVVQPREDRSSASSEEASRATPDEGSRPRAGAGGDRGRGRRSESRREPAAGEAGASRRQVRVACNGGQDIAVVPADAVPPRCRPLR